MESRTFARSDQLKHFLAYICEMEAAGRGPEINEYAIGTQALGKPDGFSPQEDSTVRTRAYSLRQKLQEYYEKERPDAAVRIELPKGSYNPLFLETDLRNSPAIETLAVASRPASTAISRRSSWLVSFALGTALVSLIWLADASLRRPAPPGRLDPIIGEAWGPLARPDANVAVCFGSPPHLHLRSFTASPNGIPRHQPALLPATPEAAEFYESFRLNPLGTPVYMWRTNNSMLLGDALAAAIAVRTLARLGSSFEMLPEKTAGRIALRGRNIMRFGSPIDSREVALDLQRARFSIRYDPAILEEVIADRPPGTPGATTYVMKRGPGGYTYGLLTVLPAEDTNEQRRTVIASGVTSAGSNAAMEFLGSPEHLRNLKRRFAAEGYRTFPPAYQVVLKCVVDNALSVRFEYEAHAVLK